VEGVCAIAVEPARRRAPERTDTEDTEETEKRRIR
jgi:hypothetical protein